MNFFHRKSKFKPQKEIPPVNDNIVFNEFILIDENGKNLGIFKKYNAINFAKSKNMDVFIINKNTNPPVAKIVNYEKYRYEMEKKKKMDEKIKRKNSKPIKEIYVRPSIGEHDVSVKIKHAQEFLKDGHKVMVSIKFKGRELINRKSFLKLLEFFKENLKDISTVETDITEREKDTFMILAPLKIKQEKLNS